MKQILIIFFILSGQLLAQLPSLNSYKLINNLKEGNKRFVNNKTLDKDFPMERAILSKGQNPYAIVVACSDSRVPPEYIFDEQLGKLFVVRTAGNVLDKVELGSIEYAAEHLHTPILLILGHTSCGAIAATMEGGEIHSPNLESVVSKIEPAVSKAKKNHKDEHEAMDEAIKENVLNQIHYAEKNSKVLKELIESKKLKVVGAIYDIKSGVVEFIEE